MSSAVFALFVNAVVALLFAGAFTYIAASNPSFRRVYWLGAAYAVGALTPASELLVRTSGWPAPFVASSFATFVGAFYVTAVALCRLYRLPVPWSQLAFLLLLSLCARAVIWNGQRDDFLYELAYQLPFAIATFVCALLTYQALPRGRLDALLCGLFSLSSMHFVAKPFLAVRFGSGSTASEYVSSVYALFSQSGTGILLTTIGITLLLIVVRKMLDEVRQVADRDALSGLLNRRGFNWRSEELMKAALDRGRSVALLTFDLDHFKRLNDTYGHGVGDWFIAAFAEVLRICCPPGAIVCRLGGEEFAVLMVENRRGESQEIGESVRRHLLHLAHDGYPLIRITVSGGHISAPADIGLAELMVRSDRALYLAKASGRDRICFEKVGMPGNLGPERRGRPTSDAAVS